MRFSLALASSVVSGTFVRAAVNCAGSFSAISASDWVKNSNPGWNLGNTLDAVPDEGRWNNPPVRPETFDDVKKAGFKSVRLPVTWTTKIGPGPAYTVDPKWLDRVATVLEQITSRGLYAIVNVHHDSWEWFDFSAPGADINKLENKFSKLWQQIATKLACTSSLVAFEPINEAKGSTKQHAEIMNRMNGVFLKAINDAGGYNPQRVVTLVGLGEDSIKTSQWFKKPAGTWKNPWALQYHYYSPYDFVFQAWGKTIWGSTADEIALEADIRAISQNFTGIPLVLGEYAASPVATEPAARWKWCDFVIRTTRKYNTATFLWDNGNDFLDRSSHKWRDETTLDIIMNANRGVRNSLPDSTFELRDSSQWTSAYIFHKSGEQVEESLSVILLNGNSFKSITGPNGTPLNAQGDYRTRSLSGGKGGITFTKEFLNKFVSPYALPGIKANLTVHFSAGANTQITIVQWDVPTIAGGAKSSKAVMGKNLEIPITWKGVPRIAAVKAVFKDGTYLADDWTKWLGPLQAGYATYGNHWDWNANNLIIKQAAVEAVIKAKKEAIFTFDFLPRVPGNSITYTLSP